MTDDGKPWTTADMERAVAVLVEHSVQPLKCPECGSSFYVANWDGRSEVLCDCGAVLVDRRTAQ